MAAIGPNGEPGRVESDPGAVTQQLASEVAAAAGPAAVAPRTRAASGGFHAAFLAAATRGEESGAVDGPAAPAAVGGAAPGASTATVRGAWRMYDFATGGIKGKDVEFEDLAAWAGGASDVPLAVIDGGVEWTHPLFADNKPATPLPEQQALTDTEGHGTHVAGIASFGTSKIKLVPLKESEDIDELRKAVSDAKASGARVVNMSFYIDPAKEDLKAFRDLAAENPDMLFVQSAGNWEWSKPEDLDGPRNQGKDRFLGNEPNAVLVANTTPEGDLHYTSAFGRATVLLAARGTEVVSSVPNFGVPTPGGNYQPMTGTSMAAPFVSNVAAKVISLCPSLKPADVREVMAFSADRSTALGKNVLTRGTINAERSYRVAALLRKAEGGEDIEKAVLTLPGGPIEEAERFRLLDTARILRPELNRNTGD
jgi:subtilisin family serine protease